MKYEIIEENDCIFSVYSYQDVRKIVFKEFDYDKFFKTMVSMASINPGYFFIECSSFQDAINKASWNIEEKEWFQRFKIESPKFPILLNIADNMHEDDRVIYIELSSSSKINSQILLKILNVYEKKHGISHLYKN